MPEYVVERLSQQLNTVKKPLNGSKVLLMGVAYKPDIDDIRESPALKIVTLLEQAGCQLSYNDPFIPSFKAGGKEYYSVEADQNALREADAVLILTNHSAYDPHFIVDNAKLVFDTRYLTRDVESDHLERL